MLAWTIYCAIVPLKTDYKLLYTFGNNCGTEKIQCLLNSDIWVPYFAIVWFQKLKHLYPSTEDSLICTLLPLAGFSVPGGFWWPPSPQEFPEFLNGDFTYLPWVPEVFLLCGGNFRCRPHRPHRPHVSTHLLPGYHLYWKFKIVLVLENKESEY